ncbi:hypothetical protein Emed_007189 [Eimeria media]
MVNHNAVSSHCCTPSSSPSDSTLCFVLSYAAGFGRCSPAAISSAAALATASLLFSERHCGSKDRCSLAAALLHCSWDVGLASASGVFSVSWQQQQRESTLQRQQEKQRERRLQL